MSYAILTTSVAPAIAHIHTRMPVIINNLNYDVWLCGEQKEARELMQNRARLDFEYFLVSNEVGNVANDYPELIKPKNEKPLDLFFEQG